MKTVLAMSGLVIAAALAGCSVDGTAVEDPAQMVDLATLDTGGYPTEPRPEFTTTSADTIVMVEGQRMVEFAVHPGEIDSGLTEVSYPMTIRSKINLANAFGEPFAKALDNVGAGFTASYATSGGGNSEASRGVTTAVVRFGSEAAAHASAKAATDARLKDTEYNRFAITKVDGMDDSIIMSARDAAGETILLAITVRGNFAIMTWTGAKDAAWVTSTTKKFHEAQTSLIAKFPRTTIATQDSSDIKMDQNKILIYTLPGGDMNDSYGLGRAVYGPRGYGNLSDYGVDIRRLLEEAGSEHNAVDKTDVFRAADDTKAADLMSKLLQLTKSHGAKELTSPKGLPIAKCVETATASTVWTHCYVRDGRYVGYASAKEIAVAHQQISAQYKILTKADQKAGMK